MIFSGKLFSIIALSIFTLSCSRGQKIDDAQLMDVLQTQVDSLMQEGYRMSGINIYSKDYSDYGPDHTGRFNFMFISAVSPDPAIQYLANFSYAADLKSLRFHGYPTDWSNKRKDMAYNTEPDLRYGLSKLEEMKKLIPENYIYDNLLQINYAITDGQTVYKFKVEIKPTSKAIKSIANPHFIKQEKKSYTKYSTTRGRRKFGTTREKKRITVKKKTQYSITFKLTEDRIEIE